MTDAPTTAPTRSFVPLAHGVPARARQVMGTMHATEIFTIACPEISRDTARDLAAFCKA